VLLGLLLLGLGGQTLGQRNSEAHPSNTDAAMGTAPKEAYVTIITTPEYAYGAEVVWKTLRHFGSTRPFHALLEEDIPDTVEYRLQDVGFITRRISGLDNPNTKRVEDRPWFATTYTKLLIFNLTEFDKLIWLDADLLILENLDHLFERDIKDIAAAPESQPPDRFNTGLMVVKPSTRLFNALMKAAKKIPSYDGSDQGFLNLFFKNWYFRSAEHRLSFSYNVLQSLAWSYGPGWDLVHKQGIKVLHFCGDASMKPWSYTMNVTPGLAVYIYLWQEIAKADPEDDITPLFDVLQLTDPEEIQDLFHQRAAREREQQQRARQEDDDW